MTVERASLADDVSSRTTRLFDDGAEPSVVRLSLSPGDRIDPHSHPGHAVVIYVVSGQLDVDIDDRTRSLSAGELLRFDGERSVSPHASEPTAAFVVLAESSSVEEP